MLRRGFTLIELLCVVAILSMLLAVLLPAVQAARSASRRTSCVNNLRQIGISLCNFHAAHRVLPPSGWTTAGSGNPKGKYVGWRALVLPYLEEDGLRRLYDVNVHWWEPPNAAAGSQSVPVFLCAEVAQRLESMSAPAKPPRPAIEFPRPLAPTDYEVIMGVQPSINPERYATAAMNRSAMFRNSAIRLSQVLDGATNTILVGECAARPLTYQARIARTDIVNDQGHGWIDSEGPFSLDGSNEYGTVQGQGPALTPRGLNATNLNEPYSFHDGGAHFVFADAHVEFVAESIALEVLAALCTRGARDVHAR